MQAAHPVQLAIEAADRAITAEDFDALLDFYAEDATLVIKPGLVARGKEQIRKAFVAIAGHFDHKLVVKQGEMQIIEGADTGLVLMETVLEAGDSSTTRRATYVFRREKGVRWLCVVDNSYGTDLLNQR